MLCGGDFGNLLAAALGVMLERAVEEALCCCGIAIRWVWRWVYEISRHAGGDVCMVCISALAGLVRRDLLHVTSTSSPSPYSVTYISVCNWIAVAEMLWPVEPFIP